MIIVNCWFILGSYCTIIMSLCYCKNGSVINSNPSKICDQQFISISPLSSGGSGDTRSVRTLFCRGETLLSSRSSCFQTSLEPLTWLHLVSVLVDRKRPRVVAAELEEGCPRGLKVWDYWSVDGCSLVLDNNNIITVLH